MSLEKTGVKSSKLPYTPQEIMTSFEQTLTVTSDHLDELKHVNNVQYLQWVQDIAGAHWKYLIQNKPAEFGLWVVRSHHIEYKRQAKLGDTLRVVTHVVTAEGFQSERRVRFYLGDTKTPLRNAAPSGAILILRPKNSCEFLQKYRRFLLKSLFIIFPVVIPCLKWNLYLVEKTQCTPSYRQTAL